MDPVKDTPPPKTQMSRRELLALGLGALPMGLLLHGQAAAQGFSQAPLLPRQKALELLMTGRRCSAHELASEPSNCHWLTVWLALSELLPWYE